MKLSASICYNSQEMNYKFRIFLNVNAKILQYFFNSEFPTLTKFKISEPKLEMYHHFPL